MLNDKQILNSGKKRYDLAYKSWQDMKQKNTELLQFTAGEQWTYQARQSYEQNGFTAFTSNRIPTFLRQITNELMKNTPEGKINSMSDNKEMSEVVGDHVRNIQQQSNASLAYTKAANQAATVGIGYWKVCAKYKDNHSFDQELYIESIQDVNQVMLDPNHKGLAGEDCDYGFISVTMSKDEYALQYENTILARYFNQTPNEDDIKDVSWKMAEQKWQQNEDTVTVCEYYFKDYKLTDLVQVEVKETGEILVFRGREGLREAQKPEYEILQQRKVHVPVIRCAVMNDIEIIEKSEFPGSHIPIVCVKADEYWIEGKRILVGAVEPAVEAQVQLNYAKSWLGMLLQMSPTAPWQGTVSQFKNFEQRYAEANVSRISVLPYNKDTDGGVLAPPPFRDLGAPNIQIAATLVEQAEADLLKIFGTFDPDNTKGVVESGKARLIRENQSFNSNYHFYEHLAHSVCHTIRIILDAIPVIYDTARQVQLLAEDGKTRTISINTPNNEGVVEYDFTQSEYQVQINTGPSFGTKQQEFVSDGMDLIQGYPECAPAIADLIVRGMQWPGADKIADSLEALVPPQVLQARKTNPKDAAAMIPSLQAQIASLTSQNQAMQEQLKAHTSEMEKAAADIKVELMKDNTEKYKVDNESKIKMEQLQYQREVAELEFLVKKKELELKQQELELKRIELAADMTDRAHEKSVDHIDRLSSLGDVNDNELENESNTGMSESLK
jgi:hypothetical protein